MALGQLAGLRVAASCTGAMLGQSPLYVLAHQLRFMQAARLQRAKTAGEELALPNPTARLRSQRR